jgi:hypothetical protein
VKLLIVGDVAARTVTATGFDVCELPGALTRTLTFWTPGPCVGTLKLDPDAPLTGCPLTIH